MPSYRFSKFSLALFLALYPSIVVAQAVFDVVSTKDAIFRHEQAWLNYEIGQLADGKIAVFQGDVAVKQKDPRSEMEFKGPALAALVLGNTDTFTIVLHKTGDWVRLMQKRDAPEVTHITRIRRTGANDGISATCHNCVPPLAKLGKSEPLFVRLAAEGKFFDTVQSSFKVELSGFLEPVNSKQLGLDQILKLRPDIDAAHRRPNSEFRHANMQATRRIKEVFKQRTRAEKGKLGQFTCYFLTPYSAVHVVDADDLARPRVEDLLLGDTRRCCLDHSLHDATRICNKETGK